MTQKIIITFSVLLYAVVVPYMELNVTHVFNPDWTPHVRIHEVWQLITNSSFGILCLWLSWKQREVFLSSMISLVITGGFLVAFSLQSTYGGSMKYLNGSENTVFGLNLGVVGFGLAAALLITNILLALRKNRASSAINQDDV
ncbi:MAG: hypothetical protein KUG78_13400 [Kangiellaceae bacterium]|nr:hypothetical protein [Kangiellaceae bacterium]